MKRHLASSKITEAGVWGTFIKLYNFNYIVLYNHGIGGGGIIGIYPKRGLPFEAPSFSL